MQQGVGGMAGVRQEEGCEYEVFGTANNNYLIIMYYATDGGGISMVWFMIFSAAILCSAFMRLYSALKNPIRMIIENTATQQENNSGTEKGENIIMADI